MEAILKYLIDNKEWISKEESRRHPQLDLYGEEREACDREREEVRRR